jgi:hypothetical protein
MSFGLYAIGLTCAKRFIERFSCLCLNIRSIGHSLFDADDLVALRALAETMTGAIHFVPWPKRTHGGQFWLFHTSQFPTRRTTWLPCGSVRELLRLPDENE